LNFLSLILKNYEAQRIIANVFSRNLTFQHHTDNVAIRQGESNLPRPVGYARMGFQTRLLAPDVEAGCYQGKMDFFNEAAVLCRIADKNVGGFSISVYFNTE
jgi:hypothetical protein